MIVLALDFSAPCRSAAVVAHGHPFPPITESGARVTRPVTLASAALHSASLEREQVDTIALGLGPGSYTGIRAAISFAQGWQLGRPVDLRGLSSVETLAEQARQRGWHGRVHIVIDAQRQELYLATFDITPQEARPEQPLRILPLAHARQCVGPHDIVCGPEAPRWFSDGRTLHPEAATLGLLAPQRSQPVPGEHLQPVYLRPLSFAKAPPPRHLA